MVAEKQNFLGLSKEELCEAMDQIGESSYRGRQIFNWIYRRGVDSFSEMSDLGRELRSRLTSVASIVGIVPVARQTSSVDGTTKFLFELNGGGKIETVLIPPASAFRRGEAEGEDEQRRLTLCVSTQVGCPLDCAFCATATMGFLRNLSAGEMIDQLRKVARVSSRPVTNIVFMGMGEPLLNYDEVMKAADVFSGAMGITCRRITVSTAGWVEGIRRLADERRRLKLAISLHSAVQETRSRLMPINRRLGLEELLEAIEYYYRKTKQRVTYEYILFDGINDSRDEVHRLVKFARRVPCKINIIPFHPIDSALSGRSATQLRPSPRMAEVVDGLRNAQLTVMVRSSAGEDISAACGQLAVRLDRRRTRVDARSAPLITAS